MLGVDIALGRVRSIYNQALHTFGGLAAFLRIVPNSTIATGFETNCHRRITWAAYNCVECFHYPSQRQLCCWVPQS